MRLIGLAVTLTLSLILAPLGAEAQPSTTIPRIGLLAPDATSWEPLRLGLRDLGYVEGKSIALEEQSSQGRNERSSELASGLVRLKVNIIVTWGTPAALAAKQATTTIPIVIAGAGDPVSSGLVSSLARPGGNVTGLTVLGPGQHSRPSALRMTADGVHQRYIGRIVAFTSEARLPAMYQLKEAVDRGGLMSYGARLPDLGRLSASYVDKILKGARAADRPVEQPTKFELMINLKTAKALGLTIPQSLLVRADQVIE